MNKLVVLLIGSLFAGMIAIGGCGGGGDDNNSTNTRTFNDTPLVGTQGTGTAPNGQALLVRLGTDNLVQSDPPVNRKLWVAIVTDTAGNPIAGVTVAFALRSGRFRKGQWALTPAPPATPTAWARVDTAASPCANEDLNNNGILDVTPVNEDSNGNMLLDSLGHSAVTTTGISDASGVAQATIVYPKDAAFWSELTLVGGSGVGTPATATFFLPGLASDYTDLTVSPPGQISPFGSGASCGDTL